MRTSVSGLLHMLRKGERMITEEMRKGRIIGDFLSLTNSSDNHKLFVEDEIVEKVGHERFP